MRKQKMSLKSQVPEHGLEALVSIMDDNKALIADSRRQVSAFLYSSSGQTGI